MNEGKHMFPLSFIGRGGGVQYWIGTRNPSAPPFTQKVKSQVGHILDFLNFSTEKWVSYYNLPCLATITAAECVKVYA